MTQASDLFRHLRETLADIFATREEAELLARDAGLSQARVPWAGNAQTFWQAALEEAERAELMNVLLAHAVGRYPNLAELRALPEQYRQWVAAGRPGGLPFPQETQAVDPAALTALLTALAALPAQLETVTGQLAALNAQHAAGLATTAAQLPELVRQVTAIEQGGKDLAPQLERAGRPAEAAQARELAKKAAKLLLLIVGGTLAALWESFIQEEVYKPLAEQVREALRRAGETVEPLEILDGIPGPQPPPTPPRPANTPEASRLVRHAAIAFDWVTIPVGEFIMGSSAADKEAYEEEKRQHFVYLSTYRIARVPVTNEQYARFVAATGHQGEWRNDARKARHPAVNVSWRDAVAFCRWAAEVTRLPIRLPTEAEWEKAARGTDGRLYPWDSRSPNASLCNYNNPVGDTTEVGRYPAGASPYGILDMAGNVREWTNTLWGPSWDKPIRYPYNARDGRENPSASGPRVLRGGAFDCDARLLRCACRFEFIPRYHSWSFGFRVVASPSHA